MAERCGQDVQAASATLTAAGLDVQHQKEHGGNQDEHQAGDKAEVVGFHGKTAGTGEGITAERCLSATFIRRCALSFRL